MILTGKVGYIKRRPKAHRLEGITTKQHSGYVMAMYPAPYPKTAQQRKAGNVAKETKKVRITPRHLTIAIRGDDELEKLLSHVTLSQGGILPQILKVLLPPEKTKPTSE